MSKHNAACCGCGWTGRMEHAQEHIAGCVKWAERYRADHDDECLDPGTEWERRQREQDEPGQVADSREQVARHRAEQIRKAGAWIVDAYAAAVLEEDWKALGYDSVQAWREGEFSVFRLLPEVRREVVERLSGGGQTVREIEAATGAGHGTVVRDVAAAGGPSGPQSPRQEAARQREEQKRESGVRVPDTSGSLTAAEVLSTTDPDEAAWKLGDLANRIDEAGAYTAEDVAEGRKCARVLKLWGRLGELACQVAKEFGEEKLVQYAADIGVPHAIVVKARDMTLDGSMPPWK